MIRPVCALALLALPACSRPSASDSHPAPAPPPSRPREPAPAPRPRDPSVEAPVRPLPPTRIPAPARIVAVGDLHGDIAQTRAALRVANVLDAQDHWTGGLTVVVQNGDVLDRGDQERSILEWLDRLADEATRAGGAVIVLNGNHEIMNVQGDFRYVTPGGYQDFRAFAALAQATPGLEAVPEWMRPRAVAFAPGGPFARRLAAHNTVQIVGDTAFVHGGLLPSHVAYGLDEINRAVRAWMLGERPSLPPVLEGEDSPVWSRQFALQSDPATCELLGRALDAARVRRLVVGHTVQAQGINAACDGRVWRIDVGLARYYRGPTQVLEIRGDAVRALGDPPPAAPSGQGVPEH